MLCVTLPSLFCTARARGRKRTRMRTIFSFHIHTAADVATDVKTYNVTLASPDDGFDDGDLTEINCNTDSDCPDKMYCDMGGNCYDCNFVDSTTCDAFDGDCCSASFLAKCTNNPAQCAAAVPCPDTKAYVAAVAALNQQCCPNEGDCVDGVPTTCTGECQSLLDRTMRGCGTQIKTQPASVQAKFTSMSAGCANVDIPDPDGYGYGDGDGDGYGDDEPSCPDQKHSSCDSGLYCDQSSNCYDCSFISFDSCDAADGDCCSDAFLKQCPDNPYQCAPKVACTSAAEYNVQMTKVSSACCPTPSACPGGTPSNCTDSCFAAVDTVVESCKDQLALQPQTTQDSIANFHEDCIEAAEERRDDNGDPDPDPDGYGGDGDGYGGDMPQCLDGKASSCGTGSYCDENQDCYDCSFISRDNCDANDNDCCSEAFLKNCPSNPFQCAPKVPCTTVQEYTQEMSKLTSVCCPTNDACPGGMPSNCTLQCFAAVETLAESCAAQIKLQPQATQDSIQQFRGDCVEQDEDRREKGTHAHTQSPDVFHSHAGCVLIG